MTCLADLMRPSVAQASLELLQLAGCEVTVPAQQTCCGQPSYNNGDFSGAARIAQQLIENFENFDYVVLPSGSCAGMLKEHYPKLLEGEWLARANSFANRVYELSTFLLDICNYQPAKQHLPARIAYHDSCAGLRELGIRQQPRTLLARAGIEVQELTQADVCCGFGGTFCAKMPAISGAMADQKLQDAQDTGADTLVGGDLGCLLALAGRARRTGKNIHFRHIAEVLIGDEATPPIAESETS
ncbi:(Fe-S)-binding protein [Congregibacter sp.]|uniref:(Fe-S)-binding protein n=1 Tax=Congregibacter sp. TaxID=2744308 RepID=UPI0039E233CB